MSLPTEIDVASVSSMREQGESFLFLDCREPEEYETAAIAGATLLPMSQLQERLGELEPHRDSRIVVHCHHGGRSLHVAHFLRRSGFEQAQSMAGGIDQWSQTIDPSIPRY